MGKFIGIIADTLEDFHEMLAGGGGG